MPALSSLARLQHALVLLVPKLHVAVQLVPAPPFPVQLALFLIAVAVAVAVAAVVVDVVVPALTSLARWQHDLAQYSPFLLALMLGSA